MKTKTHDISGRRLRIQSTSTGERVQLTDRDFLWLQALHDHGALSSRSLHALTEDTCKSLKATQRRLMILANEENTPFGGKLLERPFQQNATYNARANFLMYDLAPASKRALQERGTWSDNRPASRNPWAHSAMTSAITSAIAIGCKKHGFTYMPQHELLDRAGTELRATVPYKWNGEPKTGVLIPDALFAINYGGKYRAFVVEADRGTEPGEPSSDQRKSFKKNILQYENFISKGLYKKQYGFEKVGLMVLTVTTSPTRTKRFKEIIREVQGDTTYHLVQTAEEFSLWFRPPDVLHRLYEDTWERVGFEPFNIMGI